MSQTSRLIQPLISTEAMSTLTTVVPGKGKPDGTLAKDLLPSRRLAIAQYRQVLRTSLPLLAGDLTGIAACFMSSTILASWILDLQHYPGLWNNLLALGVCHLVVGKFLGLFPASGMNPVCELRSLVTSAGAAFLLLFTLNGLVGRVTLNEILTVGLAFPAGIVCLPVARFCTRRICSRFSWWGENVIILGSGKQGQLVLEFLKRYPQRGLKPLGVVDETTSEYWKAKGSEPFAFLGTTSELVSICRSLDCHWVIAAVADKSEDEILEILTHGSLIPNLVVLNSGIMMPTMWTETFDAAGLAGIHIRDRLLLPFQRVTKRLFDILLSGFVLLCALPLLAVIAVWMKVVSPGPVFYRHFGRIGRFGRTFGALKIRTMVTDSDRVLKEHLEANPEAMAEWFRDLKLKQDPRIIPGIGHLLRKTSLDELPQLWNVLAGDMSLVGPRPIYTEIEVQKFRELYPLYLRVRPGLTGLWQVSGRNNTTYEDRIRMDSYYVRNWSLWLDYFILLRTIRTVLLREGSY